MHGGPGKGWRPQSWVRAQGETERARRGAIDGRLHCLALAGGNAAGTQIL